MATPKNMTKPLSPKNGAASRTADSAPALAVDAKGVKGFKIGIDQAEQDAKKAVAAAQAEQDVVLAENVADATAEPMIVAEANIGSIEGEAGASGAAASGSTIAGISPMALGIGAGVLGVAAIAAGSSGGGSSSGNNNNNLAQNKPQDLETEKKPEIENGSLQQGGSDTEPQGNTGAGQQGNTGSGQQGNTGSEQQGNTGSGQQGNAGGVAESQAGENTGELKVAISGETKLGTALIDTSGANGTKPQFIQISNILAADGADANARVIRLGSDAGDKTSTTKAVGDAQDSNKLTAYEVIEVKEGVTYEQAKAMAADKGGKLLVVDDARENSWLATHLFGRLGEYNGADGEHAAAELAANGAWLDRDVLSGNAGNNAVIRGGAAQADGIHYYKIDGAAAKLTHFVVEFEDYKSPLTIGSGADAKPVVEGQIIAAEDFGKLVWNGSLNKVGEIKFQAVDSDNADTAKPLAGTTVQSLSISESADVKPPLVTPAPGGNTNNPSEGAQGGSTEHQGGNSGSTGGNSAGNGSTGNGSTGSGSDDNSGSDSGNTEESTPAEPPVYSPINVNLTPVEFNKTVQISADLFKGLEGDKAPAFIKIVGFTAEHLTEGSPSPLRLDVAGAAAIDAGGGYVVARANFDKLVWDASTNTGGKIHFVPLDSNQQPFADIKTQSIWIEEQSEKPTYSSKPSEQTVAHDALSKLDASVFAGTNADHKPAFVRIEGIKGGKLYHIWGESGAENSAEKKVGDLISSDDFGNIRWDSRSGNGGEIKFTAVDENGYPMIGVHAQTVTIYEQPAAPVYPAKQPEQTVAHDGISLFKDLSIFKGTDNSKAPDFIKITAINDKSGQALTGHVMSSNDVSGVFVNVAAGQNVIIPRSDFDKIRWDSRIGDGGSFKFQALDKNKNPIIGSSEQTVTVSEQSTTVPDQNTLLPTYTAQSLTVNVARDGLAEISETVFKGTGNIPESIKIQGFSFANALFKKVGEAQVAVNKGDIIMKDDFDKLVWDSSKSENGTFTFLAADGNGKELPGQTFYTVSIREDKTVDFGHDEKKALGEEVFKGSSETAAPAFIKIEAILQKDGTTAAAAETMKLSDSATTEDKSVTVGKIIPQADFGKIEWDASKGDGGMFKFTQVADANGTTVDGAVQKVVSIEEAPAQATVSNLPTYPSGNVQTVSFEHDETKALGDTVFKGTDTEHPATYIKITEILAGDNGTTTADAGTMKVVNGSDSTTINLNDVLASDKFAQINWDASKGTGGSFKFTAVADQDGNALDGAQQQTVTINEKEAAPSVDTSLSSVSAPSSEMASGVGLKDVIFSEMDEMLRHIPSF